MPEQHRSFRMTLASSQIIRKECVMINFEINLKTVSQRQAEVVANARCAHWFERPKAERTPGTLRSLWLQKIVRRRVPDRAVKPGGAHV